jgi:hypothetical protein
MHIYTKFLHVFISGKQFPLAGDLLGRERVTGARKARAGCDSPCNRYENIVEEPATWHAKQTFLGASQTY